MLPSAHHSGKGEVAEQETFRVRMDGQGRLVVPAEARRALGAAPGEALVLTATRGRLVLETRPAVLARLRKSWAARLPTVAELLEGRRDDAELEGPIPLEADAPVDSRKRVRR
jgi:AbrB family looped-hinge helix DNA binding protein